jgi:hypothetical protein
LFSLPIYASLFSHFYALFMLANLQTRLKQAGRWLPVFLLPFAVQAQSLNYSATNATNVTGTYTDLAATGTAITTANTDDANSAAQNIGFTFNYNGTAFTQFILNTNGLLKLGSTTPSTAALYYENFAGGAGIDPLTAAGAAETNLIMPFDFDLQQGTGTAEYRLATTGTAPNRVCTVQWKNVSDKSEPGAGAPSQYANFSFQAKLYENGTIEFVYGPAAASSNATAIRFPNVGLKGSTTATNQVTLALKGVPSSPWSATTFINQNYGLQAHNVSKAGLPDAGRTYRFTPGAATPLANDECTGATPLIVAATCTPTTVSNAGATSSGGTTSTCDASPTGPNPITSDIWYTVVVPANGAVKVTTSAITGSLVDDTVLELYSGTCTGLTYIACNDDAGPADGFSSVTVSSQTPGATLYVRVWSWNSSDTGAFGLCATTLPSTDAAVTGVFTLGTVSSTYGSPVTAQAIVNNAGAATLTNLPVTMTVTGATNYTSLLTIPTLAPGASVILTFSYPFTASSGTNTVTVTAAAPGDAVTTNNAQATTQTISALTQSHFATPPTFANGIGSNTTDNVLLLARYHVNSPAPVTSVTPTFFGTAMATDTYQAVIYSANATTGLPGTLLYTSATRIRPATALNDPVSIPNISVNGNFFVGVKQLTKANIGLAFVSDSPLRPATFYFSNGTVFNDLSTSALAPRLGINVGFGLATSTRNEALAATVSLYPNPAHQSFKLAVPAGSLNGATASLINALGQVVQTRQLSLSAAGGIADFDVSRLAAGVYSLQLKSGNDLVVKRVVVE